MPILAAAKRQHVVMYIIKCLRKIMQVGSKILACVRVQGAVKDPKIDGVQGGSQIAKNIGGFATNPGSTTVNAAKVVGVSTASTAFASAC